MTYPNSTGFKENGASRENAERIDASGSAQRMRRKVLELFHKRNFVGTADEVAAALGAHILSVRPRCSELVKHGLLRKTHHRRRSAGGGTAAVLCAECK